MSHKISQQDSPHNTPDFEALKNQYKIKILFVCLGNICRSPAAEGVMRAIVEEHGDADRFVIDSAGTGNYHIGQLPDRRMRVHAAQRGLDLTHRCRQVKPYDFSEFDIIIPMDDANESDLREMAPTLADARRIVPMRMFLEPSAHYTYVPDPYYEGSEGFELVLDLLQDGCQNLYDLLSNKR